MSRITLTVSFAGALLMSALICSCSSDKLADGFPDGSSPFDSYHASGWTSPDLHGKAWLGDMNSCAECHASDLSGGISQVSCDKCHTGWRNRCDFCHGGGPGNLTPAPDSGAHLAHIKNAQLHLAYACDTCHVVPQSIADEGHINGETAIVLSSVAGADAAYREGKCSSVYCHGGNEIAWNSNAGLNCASCHADAANSSSMSGNHASHLARGLECDDCHAMVVSGDRIADRALHTDGAISVNFSGCPGDSCSYDFATKNCTQSCHGPATWGGAYHPNGWMMPDKHGYAFLRAEAACTDCHGADLAGGSSGVSCDQCHSGGTDAWKRDCTFCHGGTDNQSGAPPEGVFGETDTSERAVGAHSAHVQDGVAHNAYACDTCHPSYTSMDDEGHINRQRTVVFSEINGSAEFRSENASCSALYCHGNGRDNSDAVSWTSGTATDCSSCHGYYEKAGLSGKHSAHLGYGLKCASCHKDFIDNNNNLLDKASHINAQPDVNLSVGQWNENERTCANTCHEDSSW